VALRKAIPELAHLGIDPFEDQIGWDRFAAILRSRSTGLKVVLTDQDIIAGIGNIYADEILYAAGLRYDRESESLSTIEIRRLHRAIAETLTEAIKYGGSTLDDEQFVDPDGGAGKFQEYHQVYNREGQAVLPVPSTNHERNGARALAHSSARNARARNGAVSGRLVASTRVSKAIDHEGLQVLRRQHGARIRDRGDRGGRSQRLGQVQRGRRRHLGPRCPEHAGAAQREDGRRHLHGHRQSRGPRTGRSRPDLDNSSGKLPIDGAEVTISRTLFRSGDSEYAINGTTCRLLDVQELLSDSGVGRQQHMIIGQGQLDSILNSSSENRRAVIEEAAGVLKHRRRKERAERRLDATQENIERLGDLVREVRRQMRPLERQAVSARSYSDVDADCAPLVAPSSRRACTRSTHDVRALESRTGRVATRERELRHELVTLDAQAASAAAEMASRREELLASTLGTLQGLAERARGTSSIIQERGRSLRQALVASADENVIATLEADAAKLTTDLASVDEENLTLTALREKVATAQDELDEAQRLFDETWGSTSSEGDEATLIAARQRIALLERSLDSLHESERRATSRLADARSRNEQATSDHEAVRRDRDSAHAASGERGRGANERRARRRRGRRGTHIVRRSAPRGDGLGGAHPGPRRRVGAGPRRVLRRGRQSHHRRTSKACWARSSISLKSTPGGSGPLNRRPARRSAP
jgi:ribosomal protein S13